MLALITALQNLGNVALVLQFDGLAVGAACLIFWLTRCGRGECALNEWQVSAALKGYLKQLSAGEVPEWLKGTGCKPVGYAYVGSNPTLSTILWMG
jgi:hypothetical protein